jgi:hypothetical protein
VAEPVFGVLIGLKVGVACLVVVGHSVMGLVVEGAIYKASLEWVWGVSKLSRKPLFFYPVLPDADDGMIWLVPRHALGQLASMCCQSVGTPSI